MEEPDFFREIDFYMNKTLHFTHLSERVGDEIPGVVVSGLVSWGLGLG